MQKQFVLGFSGDALIKPEINLIGSILRTSSVLQEHWVLGESGPCDAIIINDENNTTKPFTLKNNTKKIYVKRRGESAKGYVFFKPIRAEELVKVLLQIQSGVIESDSQSKHWEDILPGTGYKLRKWPRSDILKQDKRYPRLATYLSRRHKTIQELSDLSGCSAEICTKFIKVLEDSKILLILSTQDNEAIKPKQEIKIKKSFISQLKKRFSIKS